MTYLRVHANNWHRERRGNHNPFAQSRQIHGAIQPMQPEGFFARFRWGRK